MLSTAALALTFESQAAFAPIPLTPDSFNADIVVEKTAVPVLKVVTTATVDQGTNNGANTWMEIGFDLNNPLNGLPAPGTVIVPPVGDVVLGGGANTVTGVNSANPGVSRYSFKMPPSYKAPNGILIYGNGTTGLASGTFTLTTPAPYAVLSFLGSGGNGGCVVGVAVHHADGTTENGSFGCPDWFNGTSNVVFIANERCGSSVNFTYANINSGNPRLYFRDVLLTNTTSPVTSIDLTYVSGPSNSRNDVMGVSGGATVGGNVTPIDVTGYTYDFIVEADAAKRGPVMAADGVTPATTQSMDNTANTGNSWYERGYNINNPDGAGVPIPDPSVINTGLPAAGSLVTNSLGDRVYQLPPSYTENNALWIAIDPAGAGTLTLATPPPASVLSLLASAGNGPVNNLVAVTRFTDGSSQTNLINVLNWFDGNPYVLGANGRVDVGTAQFNNVRNTAFNPRLYPVDIILENSTTPVAGIDIVNTNTSGGRIAVFALSGTLDAIKPSFRLQPVSVTVNVGQTVQFTASAAANVPITYQWQKGTNGVFVDLVDGGNVSGATTTSLTVASTVEANEGDYRLVATDSAGSSNSDVAVLTILSPLQDVTVPTDPIVAYQPNGGSSPAAEAVFHATDDVIQKYLNNGNGVTPMAIPVGFVVTPAKGRTIVTAMRIYCANDAADRDPANYVLEGSNDGGTTWTLISSNAISMPTARNGTGAVALDPLTQAMRQVRFSNSLGYTSYRWYTSKIRGNVALMQLAEVELLGVIDTTPLPNFTTQPLSVTVFEGTSATFNATVNGTPTPVLRWQRDTGAGYVDLVDGGSISGSRGSTLTINPATFADRATYVCVASNTIGVVKSQAVKLSVLSNLPDVTLPTDEILSFGDTSTTQGDVTNAVYAIDDSTSKYLNGGLGLNAFTGFPPYAGPAGVIVTPAAGSTYVRGLRIYTADGNVERDPTSFDLAGSNDAGTTWTAITSGALAPSQDRNAQGNGLDALNQVLQEVLFPNNRAYTSYKLTVHHVRSDNDANSFQIAELELLGVLASSVPSLTVSATPAAGTISINTTVAGTLWSTADLVNWQQEGAVAPGTPVVIPIGNAGPMRFYQIRP